MTRGLTTSFFRLLTLQGSYNYERLLGVGTGVAEEPLLRDLARTDGPEAYRAAVARAAGFFNSHPYLAGLAVGAAARAEYDHAPAQQVARMREALCGPLGSLGDRLVWAGWLPLTSGLTLVALALGAGWKAVAGFLIVYNVGHAALRWWALVAGWEHGARVAQALHAPLLQRAGGAVARGMAVAGGAALPAAAAALVAGLPVWGAAAAAALAGVGYVVLQARRESWNGLRFGLTAAAAALAVGVAVSVWVTGHLW